MRGLLLPALTLALTAQTPEVLQAPIQKVRVHPDEAWVTRTARLRLANAGAHKLKFAQLPGGLALEDLRLQAKGPEGTRLGEVLVGPDRHVVPETPQSKAMLAKLDTLQQMKNRLAAQQQAASKAQEFLDQFQSSLRGNDARPLPSAGQLLDLNRGLEERLAELASQCEVRTRDLDRVEKEMKELEAAWMKLRGELDTNPNPSQVTAELHLPQGGEVEVELSYRTRQARWKPSYEARLSPDGRSLELVLFAAVTQASGEAWEGIQLELCNTSPSRMKELRTFATAPALTWMPPQGLMPSVTVPVIGASLSVDSTTMSTGITRSIANLGGQPYLPPTPKPLPVLEPGASTLEDAKGLGRTWALEGPKLVPSDGDAHRFRVMDESVVPVLQIVVAPRLDPTPFQVVRFLAPGRMPLFAGAPVLRSVGSLRLGQDTLQVPAAHLPFQLNFGPYEGLRATFQTLSQKAPFRMTKVTSVRETQGNVVKQGLREEVVAREATLTWELQERISLANDTAEEVDIEVQDRVVRSAHESVQVEPLAGSTPPSREAAPGVNAWVVHLPAKGHGQVDLGWTIRAPKEGEVMGLREAGFN